MIKLHKKNCYLIPSFTLRKQVYILTDDTQT